LDFILVLCHEEKSLSPKHGFGFSDWQPRRVFVFLKIDANLTPRF
jgi:hypothetical protein